MAIADNGTHGDRDMWPSLEAATTVSDIANFALIGSLVVGVVSTVLIVWMANVKESHWEANRTGARERIAVLDVAVAEANARANEAALELAKFKAPRTITPEHLAAIADASRPSSGVPYDFSIEVSQECIDLMEQIASALNTAGWTRRPFEAVVQYNHPGAPPAGISASTGVTIQISSEKTEDWGAAVVALKDALAAAGIAVAAKQVDDGTEKPNAIHIYIGKKP